MSSRDFAAGCAAIKEWLSLDSEGKPYMQFYRCKNLVDCMTKIQKDERNPNVYAKEPHSLTHAVDSLRYFCVWWTNPAAKTESRRKVHWEPDLYEDYENADSEGKAYLIKKYGNPF